METLCIIFSRQRAVQRISAEKEKLLYWFGTCIVLTHTKLSVWTQRYVHAAHRLFTFPIMNECATICHKNNKFVAC